MAKIVDALTLCTMDYTDNDRIWGPFIERRAVSGLVGGSDTGKSTILRELAIHIVQRKDSYLGFKLNVENGSVLMVSIEDGMYPVGRAFKRKYAKKFGTENLKNIHFIFSYEEDLFKEIRRQCEKVKYDLVIIDCYSDAYTGTSGNDQMETKKFLSAYDGLAKNYGLGVLFLHHLNKKADEGSISKQDSIGSSAFEQKLRCLFGLSKAKGYFNTKRNLQLLKGNYASSLEKRQIHLLDFIEADLGFKFVETIDKSGPDTTKKTAMKKAATAYAHQLVKNGMTYIEVTKKVNEVFKTEYSKSVLNKWVLMYEMKISNAEKSREEPPDDDDDESDVFQDRG